VGDRAEFVLGISQQEVLLQVSAFVVRCAGAGEHLSLSLSLYASFLVLRVRSMRRLSLLFVFILCVSRLTPRMSFLINPAYFRSRQDSRAERVCQWETPKELKGGLQKNLRICPLKATLLAQNTMPESGWVELTTSVPVCDDDDEEQDKERERERDKESGAKKNKNKTTRSAKYYWHPATKRVTWTRPRRDESEVSEAEILPLAGPLR